MWGRSLNNALPIITQICVHVKQNCITFCMFDPPKVWTISLGCGIVLGILFFFGIFFFLLVGGGFGAAQAPFWENPGVKGRFVRVFQDIWGWF